jgi:isoleucyl-tRNA synthetase
MYAHKETEKEILEFWKKNSIYQKNKDKNKGKKPFYFLQGPPYTSGRIHIGQAWNNSLKDAVLRFKRMRGLDVWDRAGYDMHGLPTSSKVQKKLGLNSKEDIEKFGVDKFIKECMSFSEGHAEQMSKDLFDLGIWLNYKDAYMPISEDWINSTWFLIKKAEEKKRLYEGEKTMSWCAECETALAKHECTHKTIVDKSIFVKFKVRNEKNKYILVWTTTPWTIAFNLAVMVNPELDYAEVQVEGETWILARDLVDKVMKELGKEYIILDEFKGSQLKGMTYEHPWEKEIKDYTKLKLKHPKIHTIVLSKEYVNLDAGTGLVHCAPGCGPEDYEVGHQNKIPPYNNINEKGIFPKVMGDFSGLQAKSDDEKFISKLEESKALVGTMNVEHEYAHHERCSKPVIFKTTKQWFFKVEDLKEKMIEFNKKVHWVPDSINNSYSDWLKELRDNSITRQRYWGIPIPLWKCSKCKAYKVIGSKEELIRESGEEPENLHRPWIDKIKIKCNCGKQMSRIPDILDVWIDAGVGSWACLGYPMRTDYFEKYFPPDFILEGRDQVRGWFNLLMVSTILAFDQTPFKNVYSHGMINDIDGVKMSKSLGNVISPEKVISKAGADSFRFYMLQTNAGQDVNFSWDELKNKFKVLTILWNTHEYLLNYCSSLGVDPTTLPEELELEEKYILSKLNKMIRNTTEFYEFYQIDKVPQEIESLILALSREYIQSTREKINEKPQLVLSTIYNVLLELIKILSTVSPFISEKIYQNLKLPFNLKEESVTLESWPGYNSKYIDENLESQLAIVQNIIQSGLAAREKAKKGVRWPLKEIEIISSREEVKQTIGVFEELIKSKLNVKKVSLSETFKFEEVNLSINKSAIGKDFKKDSPTINENINEYLLKEIYEKGETTLLGFKLTEKHIFIDEILPKNLTFSEFKLGKIILNTEVTEELEQEGFARELIRRVQDLRKENGLKKRNHINLSIYSKYDISKFKNYIKEKVGASLLELKEMKYEVKDEAEIKGHKFKISFVKL